jgi:hypothetical protein
LLNPIALIRAEGMRGRGCAAAFAAESSARCARCLLLVFRLLAENACSPG